MILSGGLLSFAVPPESAGRRFTAPAQEIAMVVLRLKRMGRKHRPFYRVNAMDRRSPRDGRVIEKLGWYDPLATGRS